MTLSEMIKKLQETEKEYGGDLEVWTEDDECGYFPADDVYDYPEGKRIRITLYH